MRTLSVVLCCLALAAMVLAVAPQNCPGRGSGDPGSLDQTWGPDVFGYVAKDNLEPGGPVRVWQDISSSGTLVTGLTDDNFAGPFNLGFSFRYYWYDVDRFWVGSNGYIQFGSGGLLAQTFPDFPDGMAPNNVIGPYVADWIFGPNEPGRCYYQTRGTDTLIVQWKHVRAWGATGNLGNHNFEVILSRVDTSITFQYDTLTTADVSNNNIAVGIENVSGQIGISCAYGAYPTAFSAIKFYYPRPVTFRAHDLAISSVQNSVSGAFFLLPGQTLRPWISVGNVGDQIESSFSLRTSIRQSVNNFVLASDDTTLGPLNPVEGVSVLFPLQWSTTTTASFRVVGALTLDQDVYVGNDSVATEFRVVRMPGTLAYDDGSSEQAWGWSGGFGGMAMQFVPPIYPLLVDSVKIFVVSTLANAATAQVIDDDGTDGAPGTVLWSAPMASPVAGWNTYAVTPPLTIASGVFYVAWMQSVEGITFGMDTVSTDKASRRAWEYSGSWTKNRMNQIADCMIRVRVSRPPNMPPTDFTRLTPRDTIIAVWPHVDCSWTRSQDPEQQTIHYVFHIGCPQDTFTVYPEDSVLADTTIGLRILIPVDRLDEMHDFYWTVRATDGQDTVMASNGEGHFRMDIPGSAENPSDISVIRDYRLSGYPNPFNPVTALSFDLPQTGPVSLKIYNLRGQEVATVVNETLPRGRFTRQWDAHAQASGTYFAVLKAGPKARVQKLLLLK